MIWKGRLDGDKPTQQKVFQKVIKENNFGKIKLNDFVLQGFAVDEGVRRNKGRIGSKESPDIIRKNMANFPVQHEDFRLLDFGNIYCEDGDLENAQKILANKVTNVIITGGRSIVLGGGHEVTYGHYLGLKNSNLEKKIGVINFDAHFDNRELNPKIGATSGTGFFQIAKETQINSLHIGIQRNSNTLELFDFAHQNNMDYILAEEIYYENLPQIKSKIDSLLNKVDILYVTICMDVFNASVAPGVSAPSYNGIFADTIFLKCLRYILNQEKLIALDVAEVNPIYDIQERTARLAASIINEWWMI